MADRSIPLAIVEAGTAAVRKIIVEHNGKLMRLQSIVAALEKAAAQDESSGVSTIAPNLYWPDLIGIVAEMIPDWDALDSSVEEVLTTLESSAHDAPRQSSAPATPRRRLLADAAAAQ